MTQNLRILIIDASRYDGLTARRELAKRFPEAIITLMTSVSDGLTELAGNGYRVLIVDEGTILRNPRHTDAISELLNTRTNNLGVVVLRNEAGDTQLFAYGVKLSLPLGALELAKSQSYHKLLPGMVDRLTDPSQLTIPASGETTSSEMLVIDPRPKSLPAMISHEINNPLMTILGLTELLLNRPEGLDSDLARKLRIIRRSANRIRNRLDTLTEGAFEHSPKQTPVRSAELTKISAM